MNDGEFSLINMILHQDLRTLTLLEDELRKAISKNDLMRWDDFDKKRGDEMKWNRF
jgi:hypothetical protein